MGLTTTETRALAPAQATETAIAAVSRQAIDPEIIAIAAAIYTAADGITKEQAVRAAYHYHSTGEVMGRDSYVGTKGKVTGQILEGYRAIERNIREDYQVKYRPLRADEADMHEIKEGDRALACEVYLLDTWAKCRNMGIPYEPIVGVTVVRKGDGINIPATKTAHWVLQKQARKDALRQVPGLAMSSEEVLDAAQGAGIQVDKPDGAHLSREQAIALVAEAARAQGQREPTTGAKYLSSHPEGFEGYGDEPGTDADMLANDQAEQQASADAAFAAMESAQDEAMATDKQVQLMGILVKELYPKPESMAQFRSWMTAQYRVESRKELTMRQASEAIDILTKMKNGEA
ncbi:MAG: hypothetical protein WC651_03310 [Candidatus Gracilibacteria bacterium]|jgi:hypothetical protein